MFRIKYLLAILLVCSFQLNAPGVIQAEENKNVSIRIVVLGDSITKGVRTGVSREQIYQTLLQNQLNQKGHQVEVLNQGIGGERTDMALKRLDKTVIALKPHLVTIMYGTNDSYVDQGKSNSRITADAYESNLRELVNRLQTAEIKVVLMTEPRWGAIAGNNGAGEHPNLRLEKYMERCRNVASEMELPLVDHYLHWQKQEQAGIKIGEWTTDQCHPNGAGHVEIANTMLPVLEKVVDQIK